jgi:hypothetical protein
MPAIPNAPIQGPAASAGPAQAASRAWTHRLSDAEIDELRAAARALKAGGKPLELITATDAPLPRLGPVIAGWMRDLDEGRGFVLVKGFPVSEVPEDEAALAYWIIGAHMGEPVRQNAAGDLLGHVRDVGDDPGRIGVRLYRTRAAQDFHTDGADIIGLFCLKPAKSGGLSRIVSSISVFNEVLRRRPDLVPLMFEDFHWDREADARPGEPVTFTLPIARYERGRLGVFYIGWYIRNAQRFDHVPRLTAAQAELLDLIEAIAGDRALHLDMDFQPGDMQFLKNAAILHARTAYEDWEEPERRRHLLRLWLTARRFKDGDDRLRQGMSAATAPAGEEQPSQSGPGLAPRPVTEVQRDVHHG